MSKKDREKLAQKYQFSFWEQIDEDYAAVRFCTSWATSEEANRRADPGYLRSYNKMEPRSNIEKPKDRKSQKTEKPKE